MAAAVFAVAISLAAVVVAIVIGAIDIAIVFAVLAIAFTVIAVVLTNAFNLDITKLQMTTAIIVQLIVIDAIFYGIYLIKL